MGLSVFWVFSLWTVGALCSLSISSTPFTEAHSLRATQLLEPLPPYREIVYLPPLNPRLFPAGAGPPSCAPSTTPSSVTPHQVVLEKQAEVMQAHSTDSTDLFNAKIQRARRIAKAGGGFRGDLEKCLQGSKQEPEA